MHRVLDMRQQADPDLTICVGDCPTGADRIAFDWAVTNEVPVQRFVAHWLELGRAAGPDRNQRMVDSGADLCLAFPLDGSKGTQDCMRRARDAGIPVRDYSGGS